MSNFALSPDPSLDSTKEETGKPSVSGLFSPLKADMKTNTYKILFFIRREKVDQATGECPIYARITVEKRTEISLNMSVIPNKWDSDRQCVKGNAPLAKAINDFLLSYKVKVHNVFT